MAVLSEQKLYTYLARVLELSGVVLDHLQKQGTQSVDDATLDLYHGLINDLTAEREDDAFLSDEAWNWIWQSKGHYNYIQLYGRLAWVNLQLLELL